jgi:signal transduction histidine kinase
MERFLRDRDLVIDIPDDVPPITGDAFLLEQMLLQVVDNAVKYSLPGTPIGISGAVAHGNLVLTVRNQGGGIPENDQERIFEKFYRGSKDNSGVEGTGLGLVIAKTIVESHGGKVWLENESRGPAFRFALPLEAKERFL